MLKLEARPQASRLWAYGSPLLALAITVLIGAWMSMGGGGGVAASLYASGVLSAKDVTILLPAIFLMGAQIQYMGRLLGTAGIQGRYYPMLFGISILNDHFDDYHADFRINCVSWGGGLLR